MRPMKPRPAGSAHDALVRLLAEVAERSGRDCEAGPKIAADFLDVSLSLVHRATDPDQREDLGFRRVARLTEHFGATAAAEFLARLAGGVFLPLPPADTPPRWAELEAEAAEDFGKAVAELIRAGAGVDHLAPGDRQRIARELLEAIHAMTGLLGLVMGDRVSRECTASAKPPV